MPLPSHVIRLRDPWQWVAHDAAMADRVCDVQVSRWFHRPPQLDPGARVVLVVAGISGLRAVRLNDHVLEVEQRQEANWRWEIGDRLERRNQLQLDIHSLEDAGEELRALLAAGNVRLEMHD